MCEKHFWMEHLCALQVFSSHDLSACAHAHSLEGTLVVGLGLKTWGESQVLKVQQTEAHSTELRVSSPEFLFDMEHTQIILFLKGNHFGKCSKLRGQPLQRHASVWWRCV